MSDDARQQQDDAMAERYETCVRIIHECSQFLNVEDVQRLCFETGVSIRDIERAEQKRVAALLRPPETPRERPVADDVW